MGSSGQNSAVASLKSFLGDYGQAVETAAREVERSGAVARIWAHDHTLWKPDGDEIVNRLGWLQCPQNMKHAIPELERFAGRIRGDGFTDCVLIGMGGSGLAPEVCRGVFGVREGCLDLKVIDTTHPDSILEVSREACHGSTLFLVSSKSGGTVETLSLMNYFYNSVSEVIGPEKAGRCFAAVTDPGSGLQKAGHELGFRKIFLNDPSIGGRYAALSYVGLVPAALIGMDLWALLEKAEKASIEGVLNRVSEGPDANSAAWLGVIMGVCALNGRDKMTFLSSPSVEPFAVWVEQLIAESTGKEGKGILPVVGQEAIEPEICGDDRLFVCFDGEQDSGLERLVERFVSSGHPVVRITVADVYDLGREFFRWEMATAFAGMILGINPFDQPDVESAKRAARKAVEGFRETGGLPALEPVLRGPGADVAAEFTPGSIEGALSEFVEKNLSGPLSGTRPYLAIHAYLAQSEDVDKALRSLSRALGERFRIPVTVGYGPRFLHSTGQLHKGGGRGLFVQITSEPEADLPIPDEAGKPGSSVSFGVLIRAQALGDRQALIDAGRDVLTFHFSGNIPEKLQMLAGAIQEQRGNG